jgi:hypothetical protein
MTDELDEIWKEAVDTQPDASVEECMKTAKKFSIRIFHALS